MSSRATNFRTLDLNLLRVFDVVMVERNVTRAAARLAMTQPAVSNALRRLRRATNEELFISTSSGMAPTAHAQALWPAVRSSLDGLREAFEPQGFDARVDSRSFTLAMADATAALFVPVLVEAMRREQARVEVRIVPLTSRDPRPMLELGRADIALGFLPEAAAALNAQGEGQVMRLDPLYVCEYVCVMRLDHPLAVPGALTLDAYGGAEHLRVSFSSRPRDLVDEALSHLGRARRVVITVNEFATAVSAVRRSELLTVLPLSYVKAVSAETELAIRPLPFEMPAIDVGLLWHRRHEQDSAQRWMRDTLSRAAAEVEEAMAQEPQRDMRDAFQR